MAARAGRRAGNRCKIAASRAQRSLHYEPLAMSIPASSVPAAAVEQKPLRFVTAASLFDGHDAAINIMRRLIQAQGAEVIHLGHNRSVEDVVRAALQEDADAIALSSYQGGHVEYFKYMVDMLKERGAGHIRVFGGGGGTITPEEIRELESYGVERIYHPNDGMKMGLVEMIEDVVRRARVRGRARRERAARQRAGQGRHRQRDRRRSCAHCHRGRCARRTHARTPAQGMAARRRQDAGHRHHRHRRRGQVERRRRNAAAFPARVPADAHRRARGRPDTSPQRRRAARRSHPHELAAFAPRVHALDGDAPPARGDERDAQGLRRVPQRAGL
jgi:methylmalonyl-CoA mutase cobalamin-binding domain/chain